MMVSTSMEKRFSKIAIITLIVDRQWDRPNVWPYGSTIEDCPCRPMFGQEIECVYRMSPETWHITMASRDLEGKKELSGQI